MFATPALSPRPLHEIQLQPLRFPVRPTPRAPDFLSDDFLLQNRFARELYHTVAENLPIIDFHCHLRPQDLGRDARFANITQLWLHGDHYKWRAMRTNGVDESYITGETNDWEKFSAWAGTVPLTLRNPLYHWTHLELRNAFGIRDLLGPQTAKGIYARCNQLLNRDGFSTLGLLKKAKAKVICTTDDPADHLAYHEALQASPIDGMRVLPTFRPDKALAVEDPASFNFWVARLERAWGKEITSYAKFREAIKSRHDYFNGLGCRLSDYALEIVDATPSTDQELRSAFDKVRSGKRLNAEETSKYKTGMLMFLASLDHATAWTMQLHIGALRNNNTPMFERLGPDTGYDSIADRPYGRELAKLLNGLAKQQALPKTIIYNLNPSQFEVIGTLMGCFQEGPVAGKIQMGAAWWFLDQKDGMEKHLNALSSLGLLSSFVGMVTDSRSILSYFSRHEYFRRILCNVLGRDVENGELPADMGLLRDIVARICYKNPMQYLGL